MAKVQCGVIKIAMDKWKVLLRLSRYAIWIYMSYHILGEERAQLGA